jgi:hypothetical protein
MNKNRFSILTATSLFFLLGVTSNIWSQEKAADWFIQGNTFSRQSKITLTQPWLTLILPWHIRI